MRYGIRYGSNRGERARRIASNTPHGAATDVNALPRPIRVFKYGQPPATFTRRQRYVEDINKLTEKEQTKRNFIVVRSQKYGDKLMYKDFYKIVFPTNLKTAIQKLNIRSWRCNCRDNVLKCKHIMAVAIVYTTPTLRY